MPKGRFQQCQAIGELIVQKIGFGDTAIIIAHPDTVNALPFRSLHNSSVGDDVNAVIYPLENQARGVLFQDSGIHRDQHDGIRDMT